MMIIYQVVVPAVLSYRASPNCTRHAGKGLCSNIAAALHKTYLLITMSISVDGGAAVGKIISTFNGHLNKV